MIKVIYHANCVDGATAAWAVGQRFQHTSDALEYIPAKYGDAPPEVTAEDDVYIVDFSYPREVLLEMHKAAGSLSVFDHHKTAQAALEGLSFCIFDMDRSGAGLAWDIMHPRKSRPWIIDYVEDRDLWRFKLPESREANAFLQATVRTVEDVQTARNTGRHDATQIGGYLIKAQQAYVDQVKPHARMSLLDVYTVPVVNAGSYCVSDLVGELAEGHSFAAAWVEAEDGNILYSLRSREGGVDVSTIAKAFGGGGHRGAAGFKVPTKVHFPI